MAVPPAIVTLTVIGTAAGASSESRTRPAFPRPLSPSQTPASPTDTWGPTAAGSLSTMRAATAEVPSVTPPVGLLSSTLNRSSPSAEASGGRSMCTYRVVVLTPPTGTAKVKEPVQKKAGVTIDNSSLVMDPSKGKLTTAQPAVRPLASAPTPAGRGTQAGPALTPPPAPSATSAAEEQKWREASREARKRVEDAKQRIEELDAAAHKLESDFYAWDDGQYRDRVIKPAWDKTKADLETARKELAEAEKNRP